MRLPTDFDDLLCSLNSENAEYLLVGGWAMAAHAMPRYTGDIDIFYRATPDNVERILAALHAFGITSADVTAEALLKPESIIYFGHPPLRIDLINAIDGLEFEVAWNSRVVKHFDALEVPTISLEMLGRNKEASGRPKDLADLHLIRQILADK